MSKTHSTDTCNKVDRPNLSTFHTILHINVFKVSAMLHPTVDDDWYIYLVLWIKYVSIRIGTAHKVVYLNIDMCHGGWEAVKIVSYIFSLRNHLHNDNDI